MTLVDVPGVERNLGAFYFCANRTLVEPDSATLNNVRVITCALFILSSSGWRKARGREKGQSTPAYGLSARGMQRESLLQLKITTLLPREKQILSFLFLFPGPNRPDSVFNMRLPRNSGCCSGKTRRCKKEKRMNGSESLCFFIWA
jgi:hypothetical protein